MLIHESRFQSSVWDYASSLIPIIFPQAKFCHPVMRSPMYTDGIVITMLWFFLRTLWSCKGCYLYFTDEASGTGRLATHPGSHGQPLAEQGLELSSWNPVLSLVCLPTLYVYSKFLSHAHNKCLTWLTKRSEIKDELLTWQQNIRIRMQSMYYTIKLQRFNIKLLTLYELEMW